MDKKEENIIIPEPFIPKPSIEEIKKYLEK